MWFLWTDPLWETTVVSVPLQSNTCPAPLLWTEGCCHRGEAGEGGWQTVIGGGDVPLPSDKNQLLSFERWQHWNLTLPTMQESHHTKPSVTQQVVTRKKPNIPPPHTHTPPRELSMQIRSVVLSLFSYIPLFLYSFSQCFLLLLPPPAWEQLVGFISSLSLSN